MAMPTRDPLRPTRAEAAAAWAARVQAEHAQVARLREVQDPVDFYAPMAGHFGQDPRRTDDPSLDALLAGAHEGETWLDIGAGGGRYALPLALRVARVHAIEPSPSMLAVLRRGMADHGIHNIDVSAARWPPAADPSMAADPPTGAEPSLVADLAAVDVALLAHVGYDVEDFDAWLDAAEAAASRRCVVVMRADAGASAGQLLWREIHGEPRVPYPMLPELLVLLLARGAVPEVRLTERRDWGYTSREELMEASRRQLWLRPGSSKDRRLAQLLAVRALEREGSWWLDALRPLDGIVSWSPVPAPA